MLCCIAVTTINFNEVVLYLLVRRLEVIYNIEFTSCSTSGFVVGYAYKPTSSQRLCQYMNVGLIGTTKMVKIATD